jgi:putative ABC transport system permease protein
MSLHTRIANAFRPDRLNRELDEEFEAHIADAVAEGRDPAEARRAFGSPLRQREASRQHRVAGGLDSLRADVIFGWRQLKRNKVASAAAVLSLALAMGACVSAFRLIDALLLRPLPVAHPEQLYAISYDGVGFQGKPYSFDSGSYPMFQTMRAAVHDDAELIALSFTERTDLTYSTDDEMEKANWQFVSGRLFQDFGLQPALGRLLSESDDLEPGAHPVAVLSYQYWSRRFGRDRKVVGSTVRVGRDTYEIVGVTAPGFTGTEPGTMTDIFVPTMMRGPVIHNSGDFWLRTFVRIKPGTPLEPMRAKLQALYIRAELERSKGWTNLPKELTDAIPRTRLLLLRAGQGISGTQRDYRSALVTLGVLVAMVLLIACVNVANLMSALASARAREMALRVSIGAGRLRLVQMVLVQSLMMAILAAALGGLFGWWSAPFVVRILGAPGNPVQLDLPGDWRVFGFALALVAAVTLLFGLLPALRASAVKPASALKGGDDPHSQRRMLSGMIVVQVAFCFVVVFLGALFVASFHQLSRVPLGFSAEKVLTLETTASQPLAAVAWQQMADGLRNTPGVESVALAAWPLMSERRDNNAISVHDGPPSSVFAFFLATSPHWLETMKIPLLQGRDFRARDANPQVAIVNQAFAAQYFAGENPLGQRFKTAGSKTYFEIVGIAGNAAYHNLRDPILPQVYVPFQSLGRDGQPQAIGSGTLVVRTSDATPRAIETLLRRRVHSARAEFRVSNSRTEQELIDAQTVRERLLAMLGIFFSIVALLLAGIGLYGVLNYAVMQRQREIGIRLALGARRNAIARLITGDVFLRVSLGAFAGVALGLGFARYVETLFYQVKASDAPMLAVPCIATVAVTMLATVPAVRRALRIDPAEILRSE